MKGRTRGESKAEEWQGSEELASELQGEKRGSKRKALSPVRAEGACNERDPYKCLEIGWQ